MKTITKVRLLKFFGLFNISRFFYYQLEMLNPKVTAFYSHFVKKGSICFDIGANIGRKTDIFLKIGAAKVILVEPNPECVGFLKWKYRNNKKIKIIDKAIGSKIEIKEMFICEVNSLSSLSTEWIQKSKESDRAKEFSWNKTIKIPVTTLDQLIKENGQPDFCKIDVEGHELSVFQGLTQPIPLISFEFAPESLNSTKQCVQYIANLGNYIFNFSEGENPLSLNSENWFTPKDMLDILNTTGANKTGEIYASLKSESNL